MKEHSPSTRSTGCRGRRAAAAGLLALAALPGLRAADNTPAWLQQGVEWLRDLSEAKITITVPSQESWRNFWNAVANGLNSDSIDALAAITPQAEMALGHLDQYPAMKPYADWLRQRLDYIEVADEVVKAERRERIPGPKPPAPPPPSPPPRPAPSPPPPVVIRPSVPPPAPRPPPVTVTPARKRALAKTARSGEIWKRRLAQRAAPANATALVPRLKTIFRAEGVPEQLVWLAEVESTMNPNARNPSGAAGLFQMMPPTARRFGLRVAPPPDERYDPEKQARAAAQYLRFLKGRFKDWPLALAAYNAGEGRVGNALKAAGGRTFDDIAPLLSVETQMYVPKIDAVLQRREGVPLARL